MAWLIGHGHPHAYRYGIRFFRTCIEQVILSQRQAIIDYSVSARISSLENKEYMDAIEQILPSPPDYEAQYRKLKGLDNATAE